MNLAKARKWSQIVFFVLFLFLLLKTEFRGYLGTFKGDIRLPYPVSIFLEADPLAAITNALSTGALYKGLLWSLVILIPTLFLGRFFCGWICPLGSLHHFFSSLKSDKKKGTRRIDSNRWKRWQNLKYYILIALLVSAVLGGGLAGILDPISLQVRSLALSVLPTLNYAVESVFGISLLSFKQSYFRQGAFLGLLFVGIIALNFWVTRLWCRAICPLGALLGLVSRRSILGIEKHASRCEDCNRCLLHCQGGDDPIPGALWQKAECHLCFNCVSDCPESGGIRFRFFPKGATTIEVPDLQRRKTVTGFVAGVAALPLFRSATGLKAERDARLVRPPGALDEKSFLARCVRCGECMKVCPNNALHPAMAQAGLEGLWTPVLVPRVGYCEPSCTLCSQVCPTGAIWEITGADKGWSNSKAKSGSSPIRIGTAFYDRGRCLPWAMARECIVCEEWCPTSPKAIYLAPAEVKDADGALRSVRQPYVAPERCVGCGACEYACPVLDRPAIYVTSIGESRSRSNQFLLKRPRKGQA